MTRKQKTTTTKTTRTRPRVKTATCAKCSYCGSTAGGTYQVLVKETRLRHWDDDAYYVVYQEDTSLTPRVIVCVACKQQVDMSPG